MRTLFDNCLQAIEYSKIFNLKINYIYLKNNLCFKLKDEELNNIILEPEEFEKNIHDVEYIQSKNIKLKKQIISTRKDLESIVQKFQYISVDEAHSQIVCDILNIERKENKYIDTFEGNIWNLIYSFEFPYRTDILKELEVLQEEKIAHLNPFPYMDFSYFNNHYLFLKYKKLIEEKQFHKLHELFCNKKTQFISKEQLNNFFHLSYKNNAKENKIIDKHIARNLNNVLHVGMDSPVQGHVIHIIYEPENFEVTKKFDEIDNKILIEEANNNNYKKNLLIHKNFSKLKKIQANIQQVENDIYNSVLNFCKDNIKNTFNNKQINNNWQEYLDNSGLEYKKILIKAEKIINTFEKSISFVKQMKCSVNFDCKINDFNVFLVLEINEKKYLFELLWNIPVNQEIYTNLKYKIITEELGDSCEYRLISEQEHLIKVENFEKYHIKEEKNKYNDLFYWNNTCHKD